jgi:GntR family transcriptional regulator
VVETTGPDYQRVVDDIKAKVTTGELKIGEPIPSTPKLMKQYGLSNTVVRRAVQALQSEGVLRGHPGKGVYVASRPEDAPTLPKLHAELEQLREQYERLADHVGALKGHLMDLYARVGEEFPEEGHNHQPNDRAAGS